MRTGAVMAVLALLAATPASRLQEPLTPAQIVQLLPAPLQAQGARVLDPRLGEPDRIETLSELADQEPELVTPFLLAVLRRQPAPAMRAIIVGALDPDADPAVREALDGAAADADEQVRATASARLRWFDGLAIRNLQRVDGLASLPPGSDLGARVAGYLRSDAHRLITGAGTSFSVDVPDSYRVAILGDFGTSGADSQSPQESVARAMAAYHRSSAFAFGITLGDNFYENGLNRSNHPRWETDWDKPYAGLPTFYPVAGNHDWRAGDTGIAALIARGTENPKGNWQMPARYYTFTAGSAQFFAIDSNGLYKGKDLDQLEWLDAQLAASTARWKIVYGHHPFISGGRGHGARWVLGEEREVRRLREKVLLPILREHGAQLYLAGHDHEGQLLKVDGVYQVVNGGGGREADGVVAKDATIFCARGNGFSVLRITADKLELEFVRVSPRTGPGTFSCGFRQDASGRAAHDCTAVQSCWK